MLLRPDSDDPLDIDPLDIDPLPLDVEALEVEALPVSLIPGVVPLPYDEGFVVPLRLSLVVPVLLPVVLQPNSAVASAAAAISGTLCIDFIKGPPELLSVDWFPPTANG